MIRELLLCSFPEPDSNSPLRLFVLIVPPPSVLSRLESQAILTYDLLKLRNSSYVTDNKQYIFFFSFPNFSPSLFFFFSSKRPFGRNGDRREGRRSLSILLSPIRDDTHTHTTVVVIKFDKIMRMEHRKAKDERSRKKESTKDFNHVVISIIYFEFQGEREKSLVPLPLSLPSFPFFPSLII